ncbi:MAG: D-threonate kinase [Armatimonadaceae bacterium]
MSNGNQAAILLADDLSGALEAGASFAAAGQTVCVPLFSEPFAAPLSPCPWQADLIAYSLETRLAEPSVAADRVGRVLSTMPVLPCYIKIDSTLRGPLKEQIRVLREAKPGLCLLIAPANPAAGRTVRDRVLYVRGVPVHQTEFGSDPATPVRESDLRRIFGTADSDQAEVAHLSLSELRRVGNGRQLRKQIDAWLKSGAKVILADTEEPADLTLLAQALTEEPGNDLLLPVGSGGLAAALASARIPPIGGDETVSVPEQERRGQGVLYLVGSAHPVSHRQAARLASSRQVSCWTVHESPTVEMLAKARKALQEGQSVLLCAPHRHRSDPRNAGDTVSRWLAAAASALLAQSNLQALFVTGGETAQQVLRAVGIEWLRIAGAPEPGVTWAETGGANGALLAAGRWVVVKPGGFGDENTLIHLHDALQSGGKPQG